MNNNYKIKLALTITFLMGVVSRAVAFQFPIPEPGTFTLSELSELPQSVETMKIGEMDLAKITRAVATAETANGKTGSGITHNNICGLMYRYYEDGTRKRTYYSYKNYMAGFNACSKILMTSPSWSDKKYKDMTISEMANVWTGADREQNWINNVTQAYKAQL